MLHAFLASLMTCLSAMPAAAGLSASSLPLERTSAAALSGPQERIKGRHYTLVFDTDRDVAQRVSRHMDAVHEEYTKRFSTFGVRNARPMTLYLFQTNRGYIEFLGSHGFNAANTGGLFFVGDDIQGVATYIEGQSESRILEVLQHEAFHLFAFLRIHRDLPVWIDEGIAEWFGASYMVKNRLITGVAPSRPLLNVKQAIRNNTHFPLTELVNMTSEEWGRVVNSGSAKTSLMYDQAWSLTHFLIEGDRGKYARLFMQYLQDLRNGVQPPRAFEAAFGKDTDALEKAWKDFILDLEPDALVTARDRLDFLAAGLKYLHDNGQTPANIEELRARLRAVQFVRTTIMHGVRIRMDARDDDHFTPPPSPIRGKTSQLRLTPAEAETLPPGIELTGLRVTIRVEWRRDELGELHSRIVME